MKHKMITFLVVSIIYTVIILTLLVNAEDDTSEVIVLDTTKTEISDDAISSSESTPQESTNLHPGVMSLKDQEPSSNLSVDLKEDISSDEIAVPQEETIPEESVLSYETLLDPSNVTVEELSSSLRYDLVPLAPYFLEAERLYGVNAVYLASISALESGWGRYQFRENNIFGFGDMDFESEEECIYYVAEFLSREYLSEDGMYYHGGYTLYHVNQSYNGGDHWYKEVSSIFGDMLSKIESHRACS